MNILITEIYNDEQPCTWIVTKEHATPELRAAIEKALADEDNSATCDLWEIGCQGDENESATVKLPAFVDAEITLYEQ